MADTSTVDVTVENHGSIFLFFTKSPEARKWLEENIPDLPGYMSMGDLGFKCEAGCAENIVNGMINDGLDVE